MIYSVRAHYRSRLKLHLVSSSSSSSLAEKMFNKQLNRLFCCSPHNSSRECHCVPHLNLLQQRHIRTIYIIKRGTQFFSNFLRGFSFFVLSIYSVYLVRLQPWKKKRLYVLKANPANNCQNAFMSFSSSLSSSVGYRIVFQQTPSCGGPHQLQTSKECCFLSWSSFAPPW